MLRLPARSSQTVSEPKLIANALSRTGPLTQLVKRSLQVSNPNQQPVAFKVKTTAPKQYCVRPNSGRIEPGETVEVQGKQAIVFGATRAVAATNCRPRLPLHSPAPGDEGGATYVGKVPR